jgi:GNAT superfamily N-acetyltransferase
VRIVRAEPPDPDDVALLERGVSEPTLALGHPDPRELAGFVRDEDGAIRAGVYGWTWGGCCEVHYLWVHEALRRGGLGGAILAWAEEEARLRGCRQIVVFTHACQAPGLYAASGYKLVGKVDNYPSGDSALWFQKELGAKRTTRSCALDGNAGLLATRSAQPS